MATETLENPVADALVIAKRDIRSPLVRRGFDYWLMKRGDRPYPARQEIRPGEIRSLLPNVILVGVVDGGCDYEFRVVGDANVQANGFSFQGWRASQLRQKLQPGYTENMFTLYNWVRTNGKAVAIRGRLAHVGRSYIPFESITMPLGPDGKTVDHLFIVSDSEMD